MENFLMTPMSILFKCGPGVYRQLQLLIKKTIERRVWKFEGMDTRRIFSSGRGKNMHRKKSAIVLTRQWNKRKVLRFLYVWYVLN